MEDNIPQEMTLPLKITPVNSVTGQRLVKRVKLGVLSVNADLESWLFDLALDQVGLRLPKVVTQSRSRGILFGLPKKNHTITSSHYIQSFSTKF